MTYAPPSGWMERIDKPADPLTAARFRFHRRSDCARIKNPGVLVRVDKPYHAPRCPGCAPSDLAASAPSQPVERLGSGDVTPRLPSPS